MDSFLNVITSFELNDETLLLGGILISVMMFVLTIGYIVLAPKRVTVKQRLHEITKESAVAQLDEKTGKRKLGGTLESLSPMLAPKGGEERESIRLTLMHAGFHDASALTLFYILKILSFTIGVGVAAGMYFFAPALEKLYMYMAISVGVGLLLPNIILERLANKRKSRIKAAIPDALDLLVVCTESGLGLNAAIRKVADELAISHPEFADELDTVCAKINAGVEMSDAFADLVTRTGVKDINGLVSTLSHAAKIGGSVANTLREFNDDYRDKRNQEVEEIAAKIPTKMIFPLLLFIWPCFFIVAIGPSLLNLIDSLGK